MSSDIGFNACRKCLRPADTTDLSSLFDVPGKVEKFEEIADVLFSRDKDKHNVLVCNECISEVDEAFAFRQKILQSEADHFRPRREAARPSFGPPLGLDVCRVCLTSSRAVEVKTIFKEHGENGMEYVEMIFFICGFNMTEDYPHFDGLICAGCILELEKHFRVREAMRHAEDSYFVIHRIKWLQNLAKPVRSQLEIESPTNRNLESKRTRQRHFECETCGKILSRSDHLKRHFEAIHAKAKKYACDVCGHLVHLKDGLEKHMNDKHIQKQIFKDRPFHCSFNGCNRSFAFSCFLKLHQNVHSDDRPFSCHCGESYKHKSNLMRHQRNIHAESKH